MITGLKNLNDRLVLFINTAKQNYYFKILEKLQSTERSSKTTCLYLKSFSIKIIPTRYYKNKFVIDLRKKHCCLISNSSELPSKLEYLIQSCLSLIAFSTDNIAKMIQNLDLKKVQGQDQICIRMLKLCST